MSEIIYTGHVKFDPEDCGYDIRYTQTICCCPMGCNPDELEYREPGDSSWYRLYLEGEHKSFMWSLFEMAGVELKRQEKTDEQQ